MAKAGLQEIIDAMADQIRNALEAASIGDVQVEPRYVLNPSPLTVDIYPGDPSRDADSAAFDDINGGYLLTVRARMNPGDFNAIYDDLVRLMDDTDAACLADALYDDKTLSGYASDLGVSDQSGLRAYESPSGESAHLGFQLNVLVLWADS